MCSLAMLAWPFSVCVRGCGCVSVGVCVGVFAYLCVCVCVNVHPCLLHAIPCLASLLFLSLYITFFLFFCVCLFFLLSPPFLFLFSSSLSIGGVAHSCPNAPPTSVTSRLACPIRSAAGEGGEWDAGSSESGAGSHHSVLRPWNVSGTTTTTTMVDHRAASLSPLLSATRELTATSI